MVPENQWMTSLTNARSIVIDGKRNIGCSYNCTMLFFKERIVVKEGMTQTVDKGGQHHYLSYHHAD